MTNRVLDGEAPALTSSTAPSPSGTPREHAPFVKACRGEPTPFTPIWLNRQAGRYMPEYHAVKGNTPSLDFFRTPELAARVTVDAQRILGVDAAIVFADLLPILEPMGLVLDYVPGVGPVFANPVRELAAIDRLRVPSAPEELGYIAETISGVLDGLPPDIPLIGFAGAPFTLASYAIEGAGSRNFLHTKKLMYQHEASWNQLLSKLTRAVIDYVRLQIDAGVQAVQIFDSWVGALSRQDYRRYVAPHVRTLMQGIRQTQVTSHGTGGRAKAPPIIYFGVNTAHLVADMHATGADLLALDWRTPLGETWQRLDSAAIQGNLDPIVLCANTEAIATSAGHVLEEAGGRPGHIFNLGHGIVPETPVDNVKFLVDFVHEATAQ